MQSYKCGRCSGIILSAKPTADADDDPREDVEYSDPREDVEDTEDPHKQYNINHRYGWQLKELEEWLVPRLRQEVPVKSQTRSFMAEVHPAYIEGLTNADKLESVEINDDLNEVQSMITETLDTMDNTKFKVTVPAEFDTEEFKNRQINYDLGCSRVTFEVEAHIKKGSSMSHFKIGIYFDEESPNGEYLHGQYVLYIADLG
jgi:hypothetical protein